MDEVFSLSNLTVLALIIMVGEAVFLTLSFRRWGAKAALPGALLALAAGAFLVLALRQALSGSPGETIMLCLGLSFAAHLGELALKIRQIRANPK
jgi:predicted Kef-type K+ transport protein